MIFLMSLLLATLLAVVGYFVAYSASRAEGRVQTWGNYLAVWLLILAVLVLLGGILAPLTGMGRMRGMPMMERQTGETSLIDETDVGEGRSSFVLA